MQNKTSNKEKINFLLACQEILDDSKCENIVHYSGLSDYLVQDAIVVTANSEIHCKSSAQKLERSLMDAGVFFLSSLRAVKPQITPSNKWAVIDCEEYSVMIHVMTEGERVEYKIDDLLMKIASKKDIFETKSSTNENFVQNNEFDNLDDDIDLSIEIQEGKPKAKKAVKKKKTATKKVAKDKEAKEATSKPKAKKAVKKKKTATKKVAKDKETKEATSKTKAKKAVKKKKTATKKVAKDKEA